MRPRPRIRLPFAGRRPTLLAGLALLFGALGLFAAAPAAAQTITLSASSTLVVPGDRVTLTATLSAPSTAWVSVPLRFTAVTAGAARYQTRNNLAIHAGNLSATATMLIGGPSGRSGLQSAHSPRVRGGR